MSRHELTQGLDHSLIRLAVKKFGHQPEATIQIEKSEEK